jgi:hypothetical protein
MACGDYTPHESHADGGGTPESGERAGGGGGRRAEVGGGGCVIVSSLEAKCEVVSCTLTALDTSHVSSLLHTSQVSTALDAPPPRA